MRSASVQASVRSCLARARGSGSTTRAAGKLDELRRQAIACMIDRGRVEQAFGDELLDERLACMVSSEKS